MSRRAGSGSRAGRRLLRSPLLHFLALGLVLAGAERALQEPPPPPPVHLSAEELESLEREWTRRTGRPPGPEVRERLIAQRVDEELMLREARARRWDRTDPVVVRRLVRNQRFLDPESEADDATLLARAYEQGMERSDEIVRRRLIERVRLAVSAGARAREPEDAELRALLEAEPERFQIPGRVRFVQVFRSAERLRAEDVGPEEAAGLGDPFLHPASVGPATRRSVASRFGVDFARAVFDAPLGRWVGPIASSYGQHAVWIEEREEARLGTLEEQRAALRAELLRRREERALRALLAELREGVTVRVEGCPECGASYGGVGAPGAGSDTGRVAGGA